MSRIYWDTNLFIYLLESHVKFGQRVREIRKAMVRRDDVLCTSVFTLGELLVGAHKAGDTVLASRIRDVIRAPYVDVISFTPETADRYARIRADLKVKPIDAIHLASAAQTQVDLFLTNDTELHKLTVPGIDFVAGIDVNLF